MAVYDNTYNPYGDTQFNALKDYQTWMKQGLASKGIKTPKFIPDNRMGPQTTSAMQMVTGQGLISPQVQPVVTQSVIQPKQGLVPSNTSHTTPIEKWGEGQAYRPGVNVASGLSMDQLTSNYSPEELGKMDFEKLGYGAGTLGTTPTGSSNWVDGLSNYETLQGAAGLGGLAMNAYGMFGSGGSMDVNKKNIELMNQQLANNRDLMATRQARAKDISGAFGPKTGLGA